MLKKVAVLMAVLAAGFGILMLTARGSSFEVATSLTIDHSTDAVWTALTAVEQWPAWWPGMQVAKISPGWQPGAALTMVLQGDAERSPAIVEIADPGRELAWRRQGILGSTTRMKVNLETVEGGTLVSLESSILGPQALLAKFTAGEEFASYQKRVLESLNNHLDSKIGEAQ